jgi:hypothetical protein
MTPPLEIPPRSLGSRIQRIIPTLIDSLMLMAVGVVLLGMTWLIVAVALVAV